jgi:uncharacterized RDD family membrane protein YckC
MYHEYGGFWRRATAITVDKFILFFLSLILLGAAYTILGFSFFTVTPTIFMMPFIVSYYLTNVTLNMLYFTYFHGTTGQTPGKKMFGLKVVQTTGETLTPGLAFLRWVGYLVSGIFFYLGFIWVAFDERKQGWHDKIAGTVVIRTRQLFMPESSVASTPGEGPVITADYTRVDRERPE